jgi:hypothetical protein
VLHALAAAGARPPRRWARQARRRAAGLKGARWQLARPGQAEGRVCCARHGLRLRERLARSLTPPPPHPAGTLRRPAGAAPARRAAEPPGKLCAGGGRRQRCVRPGLQVGGGRARQAGAHGRTRMLAWNWC